jgi:hypothetical protein
MVFFKGDLGLKIKFDFPWATVAAHTTSHMAAIPLEKFIG